MKSRFAKFVCLPFCSLTLSLVVQAAAWAIPVASDPALRLWLNPSTLDALSLADGANISSWSGSSLVANNVTAASGFEPKFYANQFNGHSVARFDGTDLMTGTVSHDAQTVYYVAKFSGSGIPWASSKDLLTYFGRSAGGTTHYLYDGSGISPLFGATNPGVAEIWGGTYSTVSNQGTIWVDGIVKATGTNSNATNLGADRIGNRTNGDSPFFGDVAEVLVYSSPLNNVRRILLENHLAAKYAITLTTNKFYDGDSVAAGDYDRDVFGIGALGVNSVATDNAAGLALTATGTLDNNEWVMAGHKAVLNSDNVNLEGIGGTRWARVWNVDKSDGATVDGQLSFDFSDAGLTDPMNGAQYSLIYSPTKDYSWSVLATNAASGDAVNFALLNAQLNGGYYTLAAITPVPEPSTLAMLGAALALMGRSCYGRRRRNVATT